MAAETEPKAKALETMAEIFISNVRRVMRPPCLFYKVIYDTCRRVEADLVE